MTANGAPSPLVASTSGSYYNTPYLAFDGNLATADPITLGAGCWLEIDFGAPVANPLAAYGIVTDSYNSSARQPKNFVMQGSVDGTAWDTLDTQTGVTPWVAATVQVFACATPTATLYRYFRVSISAQVGSDGYVNIEEIYLYAATSASGPLDAIYVDEAASPKVLYGPKNGAGVWPRLGSLGA